MRHPRIALTAIAIAAAATIGGISVGVATGSTTPSRPAAAGSPTSGSTSGAQQPASQATVQTASATVQGTTETILVDAKGLPLYIYQPDTPTTSRVTGQLAALWPPVVATTPTARGATGTLTSVATTNGRQVAYNGHFLYTFIQDSPDHVTGQGVQNFFVATPDSGAGTSTTMTAAPSQSRNGYGY
jgi:predicted lipoprotein with Yx(FWY)xxD motif